MVQSESQDRPKKSKPSAYILKYEKTEAKPRMAPSYIDSMNTARFHELNSNRKPSGKGWQRSRSIRDNDSSSELCFSEETAMQRRGRSAGRQGRGTEVSESCYYCKDCRKSQKRQSQRGRSTESTRRSTRDCTAQQCRTQVPKIPIQQRVTTCPAPKCVPECVSPTAELIGFTHIKDSAYFDAEKENREGPKPRKYIQKLATEHKDETFPKASEEDDLRARCVKRHMIMLVKTGDFVEYGYCVEAEKTEDYETVDTDAWEFSECYKPKHDDELKDILEVARIEFHRVHFDENNELPGRIYLKLIDEAKVDCLKLCISQTEMQITGDGSTKDTSNTTKLLLLPNKSTEIQKDGDFYIKRAINRRLHLKPGSHAIHFTLVANPRLEETFVKVSGETGEMTFNNYSVELLLKLNNMVRETNRISYFVRERYRRKQESGH